METVIRLRLSELTAETISRVKKMVSSITDVADPEINIVVEINDRGNTYLNKLNESIEQMKRGEVILFTMEEFADYVKSNFPE